MTRDITEMKVGKITTGKLAIGFALLLVVIFGILRSQCPSAADRANAITTEDVEKMAKGYERAKTLQRLGRQLETSPPEERDRITDAMIDTFDPATQARLRALPSRGDRLDAITTEMKKETAASIAETKSMQPHFWCR